jgi:TrmH family RNA methyltransferase
MISKSQLKYIQSLGQKKYRDDEGVFIAEGPKLVKELLQNKKAELKYLYALSSWMKKNKELLANIDVTEINETGLERISQLKTPNEVLAVFKKFETKELLTTGRISIVLDAIRDPGNLGTIIRIADWFAVPQIICSYDCADVYNSKVVQSTMGSLGRVDIYYADLSEWLRQQKTVRIYAAVMEGKDVTGMSKIKEGLIMIGNESKGIHDELLKYANEKITIPKKGKADSLNAAVAAGIILSYLA